MRKSDFYKGIVLSLPVLAVFSVVSFLDATHLAQSEKISTRGLLVTMLDFNSGGISGITVHVLFFVPVVVVAFGNIWKVNETYELLRYRTRGFFTKKMIFVALLYSTVFMSVIELMKFILAVLLTGSEVYFSAFFLSYLLPDLLIGTLFYYRIVGIYLLFRSKFDKEILGILLTVFVYYAEYVFYNYVFVDSPVFPCHSMTVSFSHLVGKASAAFVAFEACVSLGLDVLITLILIIVMRRKDVLHRGE